MNRKNKLLRISYLKKEIERFEEKLKTIISEINLFDSDNANYLHINELYEKYMRVEDKLFNLRKELYYLQEGIISRLLGLVYNK